MVETHNPVTRTWLESQSTDDLIRLADSYGIDIPAELERIFIIEEIIEYTEAVNEKKLIEDIEIIPSNTETALLPKQYNISFIEVVIRDPLWVFAYWEIKSHDREMHENANDFKGYYIRVIPLNDNSKEASSDNFFMVSVTAEDNARYLGFAEHSSQDAGLYVIKLCVMRGTSEIQIACSSPFYLPRMNENADIAIMCRNPLMLLSGLQDLSVTTNTDRLSRTKRQ
ncbi:MAG: DUF4912 domain-containing protein [Treponema sp.]|nr:DUF4912 domain-containing protein [Treponema sp.]